MPVSTISADKITYDANGRPQIVPTSNNTKTQWKPRYKCRAVQLSPRFDLVTPGSPVAVDCEGMLLPQETGARKSGVGRISIVNTNGEVIYDTFVYCPDDVEHRPSPQWLKMGVKYNDIKPGNGAQPHAEVLKTAAAIFKKSSIMIAYDVNSDLKMLRGLETDGFTTRDTQRQYSCRGWSRPALRDLASSVLGRSIQQGEHSSVEDARATMELYLLKISNGDQQASADDDNQASSTANGTVQEQTQDEVTPSTSAW